MTHNITSIAQSDVAHPANTYYTFDRAWATQANIAGESALPERSDAKVALATQRWMEQQMRQQVGNATGSFATVSSYKEKHRAGGDTGSRIAVAGTHEQGICKSDKWLDLIYGGLAGRFARKMSDDKKSHRLQKDAFLKLFLPTHFPHVSTLSPCHPPILATLIMHHVPDRSCVAFGSVPFTTRPGVERPESIPVA